MTKILFSLFSLILFPIFGFAQVEEQVSSFPNRAAYAAEGDQIRAASLATFKADFSLQESGILHVYIDPSIDPEEVYLFAGQEASGTTVALLPAKFQRLAKRLGAKIYATKAIKISGTEDVYLIRLDGIYEDRIEMFAINGSRVEHLKTLAYRSCLNGKCTQLDTWITDINGDTDSELIRISRVLRNGNTTASKESVMTLTKKGKWKTSRKLAKKAPWSTVEFYDNN